MLNVVLLLYVWFVVFVFFFFFFQAEDGIRDGTVTGVQTCALPISQALALRLDDCGARRGAGAPPRTTAQKQSLAKASAAAAALPTKKRGLLEPARRERRLDAPAVLHEQPCEELGREDAVVARVRGILVEIAVDRVVDECREIEPAGTGPQYREDHRGVGGILMRNHREHAGYVEVRQTEPCQRAGVDRTPVPVVHR